MSKAPLTKALVCGKIRSISLFSNLSLGNIRSSFMVHSVLAIKWQFKLTDSKKGTKISENGCSTI